MRLERAARLDPFMVTGGLEATSRELVVGAGGAERVEREVDVKKESAAGEGQRKTLAMRLHNGSGEDRRVNVGELLGVVRNLRQRKSAGRIHNGRSQTDGSQLREAEGSFIAKRCK